MRQTGKSAALAVSLACACGLHVNGDDLSAPRLSIVQIVDGATLSWWFPPQNATGYAVERRVGTGDFVELQRVNNPEFTSTMVSIGTDGPFGTLGFRVRAEPSKAVSNVVTVLHPAPPPQLLTVTRISGAFQVTFQKLAAVGERPIDTVVLSRRVVQANGTASAWVELARSVSPQSVYLDRELAAWLDAAHYDYQSTFLSQGAALQAVEVGSEQAPYLAPVLHSATSTGVGIQLVFSSPSKYARTVEVSRRAAQSSVVQFAASLSALPNDAPMGLDDPAPQSGTWSYELAATGDAGLRAARDYWAVVSPAGLAATVIDLPQALEAARTDAGTFAVLARFRVSPGSPSTFRALVPPGNDGSDPLRLPDSTPDPHSVLLDGAGRTHAVFLSESGTSVLHGWHDGTAWQTERVATVQSALTPAAGFGTDGTLHAAFGAYDSLTVGSQVGGAWAIETLRSPFPTDIDHLVAGDAAGAPHVILPNRPPAHLWKDASGWRHESTPVPQDLGAPVTDAIPIFFFARPTGVTLVQRCLTSSTNATAEWISVSDWSPSGWSLRPSVAEPIRGVYEDAPYRAAISRDGQRVAVASDFGTLIIFDQASSKTLTWKSPGSSEVSQDAIATGFEPDGKAWVLEFIGDRNTPAVAGEPSPARLYEER